MMRVLLTSCLIALSLGAMADEGPVDGSKVKKITFSGDQVIIEYNNGGATTTGDMAEVTIDMSTASGIEERTAITRQANLEGKPVYNLEGQLLGSSAARLEKGVYVIDGKKIIVK